MDRDLACIPLFHGISPASLRALAQEAAARRFRSGETLYRDGDPPDAVFALLKGRVKVGRSLENGVAVMLNVLRAHDVAGVVGAMSAKPHGATATALSSVSALRWRSSLLLERVAVDNVLSVNVSELLGQRLQAMTDLVEELASPSVEPRLARVLLRLAQRFGEDGEAAEVRIGLTQADLAELARTTVPTVSRMLGRWRQAGIVTGRRGHVTLMDRARLAEIGRDLGRAAGQP